MKVKSTATSRTVYTPLRKNRYARIAGSVLFRHHLKFFVGEDWTVFAHELVSYVAPSALSDAALHPHLERQKDILGRESEFVNNWHGELYHYRWAADDGDGVV